MQCEIPAPGMRGGCTWSATLPGAWLVKTDKTRSLTSRAKQWCYLASLCVGNAAAVGIAPSLTTLSGSSKKPCQSVELQSAGVLVRIEGQDSILDPFTVMV